MPSGAVSIGSNRSGRLRPVYAARFLEIPQFATGIRRSDRSSIEPGFQGYRGIAVPEYAIGYARQTAFSGKLSWLGDAIRPEQSAGAQTNRIERHSSSIEFALDAIAEGAFVMRSDCHLIYANRAAHAMLAAAAKLRLRNGRVQAVPSDTQAKFTQLIMSTATTDERGAMSLRLDRRNRVNLTTMPARGAGGVLMLAADVRSDDGRVAVQLQHAFHLTAAEADIACLVASGDAPAEIAQARGALLSTVQSQIKSIAAKLDCNRQAEIVAIVRAMPRFIKG